MRRCYTAHLELTNPEGMVVFRGKLSPTCAAKIIKALQGGGYLG